NYTITYKVGKLTVNKAPLTITADALPATAANDAFSKTYDGHAFSGFTIRYDGFVNSDNPGTLGGALTFSGPATTAVNAGSYAVTPGGMTSNNYTVSFVDGSLNIGKAPLTVKANDATFDEGSINLANLAASYSGFVNNETIAVLGGTLTLTSTATTASAPGQ